VLAAPVLNKPGEPRFPFRFAWLILKKGVPPFLACAGIKYRVVVAGCIAALFMIGVLRSEEEQEGMHFALRGGYFWKVEMVTKASKLMGIDKKRRQEMGWRRMIEMSEKALYVGRITEAVGPFNCPL